MHLSLPRLCYLPVFPAGQVAAWVLSSASVTGGAAPLHQRERVLVFASGSIVASMRLSASVHKLQHCCNDAAVRYCLQEPALLRVM